MYVCSMYSCMYVCLTACVTRCDTSHSLTLTFTTSRPRASSDEDRGHASRDGVYYVYSHTLSSPRIFRPRLCVHVGSSLSGFSGFSTVRPHPNCRVPVCTVLPTTPRRGSLPSAQAAGTGVDRWDHVEAVTLL